MFQLKKMPAAMSLLLLLMSSSLFAVVSPMPSLTFFQDGRPQVGYDVKITTLIQVLLVDSENALVPITSLTVNGHSLYIYTGKEVRDSIIIVLDQQVKESKRIMEKADTFLMAPPLKYQNMHKMQALLFIYIHHKRRANLF